jgi:hypothetical protein
LSYVTPYASVEELVAVTNKDGYVYWRVARCFALVELNVLKLNDQWTDGSLSERPVIVYDGGGNPKYYEYRIIENGVETGAITVVAQKKEGGPLAYVLLAPGDYSEAGTERSGVECVVVDAGYPSVAFGTIRRSGGRNRVIQKRGGVRDFGV